MSLMVDKQTREQALATIPPVEIAKILYTRAGLDFDKDLVAHLRDGYVVSRPWLFMMFRAVELDDGRHAWLLNSAVGNLDEMPALFPFALPWIAFYRRNDKRMRVVRFDRAIQLSRKFGGHRKHEQA